MRFLRLLASTMLVMELVILRGSMVTAAKDDSYFFDLTVDGVWELLIHTPTEFQSRDVVLPFTSDKCTAVMQTVNAIKVYTIGTDKFWLEFVDRLSVVEKCKGKCAKKKPCKKQAVTRKLAMYVHPTVGTPHDRNERRANDISSLYDWPFNKIQVNLRRDPNKNFVYVFEAMVKYFNTCAC